MRLLFAPARALPVVPVSDALVPLARPRAADLPAALPEVADGGHGVACAPVCAPDDVVVPEVPCFEPWLDRVDGVGDDVLPLPY